MIAFRAPAHLRRGCGAAIVGAHLANVSTSGLGDSATLSDLPERLLKGWFAVVEEGALGFTIATLARSQLAGIGVGIAFYFGEGFASIFLPDIVKYLPFSVANASLVTGSTTTGGGVRRRRQRAAGRSGPRSRGRSGWSGRWSSPRSSPTGRR
jgi:hypothetical protein